jgi:hypothetical protein
MLPEELIGPGLSIQFTDATEFLENARSKYPTLTEDFVLQICFEHADRFSQYFPKFSFDEHSVINRKVKRNLCLAPASSMPVCHPSMPS